MTDGSGGARGVIGAGVSYFAAASKEPGRLEAIGFGGLPKVPAAERPAWMRTASSPDCSKKEKPSPCGGKAFLVYFATNTITLRGPMVKQLPSTIQVYCSSSQVFTTHSQRMEAGSWGRAAFSSPQ